MVRMAHRGRDLGLVVVDQLACPQHRESYLDLALNLTGVCGLALENARAHRVLVDMEKLSALGGMVAGIAHEFNTPIGVCLAASSLLQDQTDRVRQAVTGRSLTQPGLQAYLDDAGREAALIRGNLERLGGLIERSRQLAIDGEAPPRHALSLRTCIEEVIGSLAPLLAAKAVAFSVQCREDLSLTTFPGAWTSIFTNLITNSLQHGFAGRDRGRIEIAANADHRLVEVDYRDDGWGLSAEAQARIFDPFFTTDLQHGTGLGMNLVFNLVTHRLGGVIVCGNPASGVHFHLEVPT
jgi:signal transduction histidine kinase